MTRYDSIFEEIEMNLTDYDDGEFAYSKVFPAAPNPCLRIERLGSIGLPLSVRDAQGIAGIAKPSDLFSTECEPPVEYEVPGSKVSFDNPVWAQWMEETAHTVYQGLSFTDFSEIGCRLSLLSVRLEGARKTSRSFSTSTECKDRRFGTLLVVLPACRTGGQVHATLDKKIKICLRRTHEQRYIDSRRRSNLIYLIYDLIHKGKVKPLFSVPTSEISSLSLFNAFQSWRLGLDLETEGCDCGIPLVVTYLLNKHYPDITNLEASLENEDRDVLLHLLPCRTYGFDLYIAPANYAMRRDQCGFIDHEDSPDSNSLKLDDDEELHDKETFYEIFTGEGLPLAGHPKYARAKTLLDQSENRFAHENVLYRMTPEASFEADASTPDI